MMMPRIRSILYTTDLSENSTYVFKYALKSAEVHDAKIHVLYVLRPIAYDAVLDAFVKLSGPFEKEDILKHIKKDLDDFVQSELKDNPDRINRVSSIQVVEGNPVIEILQLADELNADVIAMGTHGKGIISQTFLGSVASSVLQHSRIPVYVIPIPKK